MRDSDRSKLDGDWRLSESEFAAKGDSEIEEMLGQVPKALEQRRWQPREEPFRGFGSPPGRF